MFGRKKRGGRRRKVKRAGWWAAVDTQRRRRFVRSGAWTVLLVAALAVGASTVRRLEAHVVQRLLQRGGEATLSFLDLPASLDQLARDDLTESVAGIMARPWTDDTLCREMAGRLAAVGWIARVDFVRRTGSGAFEVGASYRLPAVMIQQDGEFMLLDGDAVRLPGTYLFDPAWKLIQGVEARAPGAGKLWAGDDVRAALAVASAIQVEPFGAQITGVLVKNFGGRVDRHASHISLATDRAGGRVRWGSAPGLELEENSVAQKIAILRANFQQTGRVDAHHPVIDVSTFPDRYLVPQ